MDCFRATNEQPTRSRRHRTVGVSALAVLIALIATFSTQPATPAAATAGEEAQFVAALNQVRAGVGLPAFTVNAELVTLSRGHAQVMADAGQIFHADPISAGFTGAWAKLGENVGVGANVAVLVDAFVASPGHYANIVDPAFTQIGVGVVWQDDRLYTTHRFLQLPGAPATTTTTVAPTATTVPSATSSTVPTTTLPPEPPTTTLPPELPLPVILPERIIELLDLADLVGS